MVLKIALTTMIHFPDSVKKWGPLWKSVDYIMSLINVSVANCVMLVLMFVSVHLKLSNNINDHYYYNVNDHCYMLLHKGRLYNDYVDLDFWNYFKLQFRATFHIQL